MRKQTSRKELKPVQEQKRVKTSLNLPEDLWTAARIKAIEMKVDAQDLVALAIEQFLKRGGAR